MATKAASTPTATGEQNKKAPALYDVGELRSKHKVGRAVFAGVCSAQGWKPGKAVRRSSSRRSRNLRTLL